MTVTLTYPLTDAPITSVFGERPPIETDKGFITGGFHYGTDWAAKPGTPIGAAAPGSVIVSGWVGAYGYAVYIDHGNGIVTRYAHMIDAPPVRVWQVVDRGQTIGYVGSTGASTGPHLHMEVVKHGTRVNPLEYLTTIEPIKEDEDIMSTIYARATANSSPTKPGDAGSSRIWAGDDRRINGVLYSGVWAINTDTGEIRRLTSAEWRAVQGAYLAADKAVPLAAVHGNDIELLTYARSSATK